MNGRSASSRLFGAPRHSTGMVSDIVNGHRQRGIVSLYRHPQRIAHQQDVNAFVGKSLAKL